MRFTPAQVDSISSFFFSAARECDRLVIEPPNTVIIVWLSYGVRMRCLRFGVHGRQRYTRVSALLVGRAATYRVIQHLANEVVPRLVRVHAARVVLADIYGRNTVHREPYSKKLVE